MVRAICMLDGGGYGLSQAFKAPGRFSVRVHGLVLGADVDVDNATIDSRVRKDALERGDPRFSCVVENLDPASETLSADVTAAVLAYLTSIGVDVAKNDTVRMIP